MLVVFSMNSIDSDFKEGEAKKEYEKTCVINSGAAILQARLKKEMKFSDVDWIENASTEQKEYFEFLDIEQAKRSSEGKGAYCVAGLSDEFKALDDQAVDDMGILKFAQEFFNGTKVCHRFSHFLMLQQPLSK